MTDVKIIEWAKKCGWDNPATNMAPLYEFAKLVAQHERERIFGELLKMHEIASSQHNYYLNAVLTIRARGEA